ncbi:DMT family transporter [bacterium]|nr:DMT family transporter [bacterium]
MQGPLFIFIAAVLWGLDGVLRRSLYSLPAPTIVFYEHLVGALIIAPFLYVAWKHEVFTKREWGAMSIVSLFSGALGTVLFTAALNETHFISFSVVYLLQKLQPIFTIGTAWYVLNEKPTRAYALWALLALIAGYFVTFPGGMVNFGEGGGYILAALLAFGAAVCWGSSTVFSRYVLLNHSNTVVTGLRFLLTVPIAFLFVLLLGKTESFSSVTPVQFGTLVFIALSTGMLALWIYYRGLAVTPARVSAIVELAFPVTAVVIDYVLYGTMLAFSQYLAAAVLLFAMYRIAQTDRM